MTYIKAVTPLNEKRLHMEMESGASVIVDLSVKLHTMKYQELADEAFFCDVKTDGEYIVWGDGRLKVTVYELMKIALLG